MGFYIKQKPKSMCFGKLNIRSIFFGKEKVWPEPTPIASITISPTYAYDIASGGQSSQNISVTASSNSWTVEASETWITVSKSSNSRASYSVSSNSSISSRTGYIYFKIDNQTLTSFTITQKAAIPYININPSTINIDNTASSGTITVGTNVPDWAVYVYQGSFGTGLTATKQSSTRVSWTTTENPLNVTRSGSIIVSGAGVSQECVIHQYAGYVFYFNNTSTATTVGSGSGNYAISIVSSYQGVPANVEASIATDTIGLTSFGLISSGSSNYIFNAVYPARTETTSGQSVFIFRQIGSNSVLTFRLIQNGKYVAPTVDGVTTAATYGNWILGTVATNKQSFPAGTFDINGVCVVTLNPITEDYTAHIDKLYYQTGPVVTGASPTSYTIENQDYSIPAGSTFTASGVTYNGKLIVSPNPRLQINGNVTGFTVS
ncbi:MAG: BACON domain-containing protein [Methanobrevibacter sp.]|nr:BACON domain-containing protein [Methanobrevibacter sp.]